MNSTRCARLYHGTSVEAARRIAVEGFLPRNPSDIVADLERKYQVPPGTAQDSMIDYATRRHAAGDVSFATGWGLAARYARRYGGESRLMALAAIGRHFVGDDPQKLDEWLENQALPEPAVITIEAKASDILERTPRDTPHVGPPNLFPADDPMAAGLIRVGILHPSEVLLVAPIPAAWVAEIHVLEPYACEGVKSDWVLCDTCVKSMMVLDH